MTRRLAVEKINGYDVTFFEPPHNEPDFAWVDVIQLFRAFLPEDAAQRMLEHTQQYENGRAACPIKDGDRVTTIMCHAMAQGACMSIDTILGHVLEDKDDEKGPVYHAYITASLSAEKTREMNLDEITHAVKNPGGPFLREKHKKENLQ